jgi:lambda repressor-like predicted transcriptional regulator
VFERAQKAFAEKDYASVFHCIAPATRKSWLGSMVFSGELAAMGRTSEKGERRAALEDLRAILDRYGASLSVEERLAGLTLEELQVALMRKVEDPTDLFAELLGWAARQNAPTDPMRALGDPKVVFAPTRAGSILPELDGGTSSLSIAGPSGLAGVLGRLAAGAPIGEIKVVVDLATGSLKRDGGSPAGDVQRFVKRGGSWFLDE